MPTEIEKSPGIFEKEIPCFRADFEEIVGLLENMGVDAEAVYAHSNGAQFQGLNDIKSAPARFSGEPFVRVSINLSEDLIANANISFRKLNTVVTAGKYIGGNAYDKENDALAKRVYEELGPFSNKLERWTGRITSELYYPSAITLFFLFVWKYFKREEILTFIIPNSVLYFLSFTTIILYLTQRFLKTRLPVSYNPRTTIWQRHGESTIVGICSTLFTAFFVWYFTK